MSRKGESCKTCDGACCKILIGYEIPDNVSDLGDITVYSDRDLRKHGYKRIIEENVPTSCDKQIDGLCSIHKTKPKLCRSFWCYGKLWKPKLVFGIDN